MFASRPNRPAIAALSACIAACLTAPTGAGTLEGRIVTLHVLTYDDPANPILEGRGRTVKVDSEVEFGLGPEYRTPGFDIVPVEIEIDPARITFAYPAVGTGAFFSAAFNGYVLRFETDCALFERVTIDPAATTMAVTEADIFTDRGQLFINVAGRSYGPDVTLALDLVVADCPLS
ncbi:MAG: hypothetical protein ACK4GO_02655 [Gemmobacter sp.]